MLPQIAMKFIIVTYKLFVFIMDCPDITKDGLVIRNWPTQNLPGKLGQQSTICWDSLGLFRDYGLNGLFFRNKTFLFFKIES